MIQTKRLVLKRYDDKDQDAMLLLLTNDVVKQTYMLPDFKAKEDAIPLFKRIQKNALLGDRIDRGIYLEGKLIGFTNAVEIKDKRIEVGYVINPEYHNQGYATEMLDRLIEELFKMGYIEVVTGAFVENIASRRVMEKCGMNLMELEEEIEYRGIVHQCVYYIRKAPIQL